MGASNTERKPDNGELERVTQKDAASRFPELVNLAGYSGKRTIITRYGEDFAVIVPIADLPRLLDPAA